GLRAIIRPAPRPIPEESYGGEGEGLGDVVVGGGDGETVRVGLGTDVEVAGDGVIVGDGVTDAVALWGTTNGFRARGPGCEPPAPMRPPISATATTVAAAPAR